MTQSKLITPEEIKLIGISGRIANQDSQSALVSINETWSKFFNKNLAQILSHPKNPGVIFAVYHDYETDYSGAYSLTLGCQVESFSEIPPDCIALTVPTAKYQIFTAQGSMPEALGQTWGLIWNSPLERTYQFDFEVYDQRYHRPEDKEVDIYIGVK